MNENVEGRKEILYKVHPFISKGIYWQGVGDIHVFIKTIGYLISPEIKIKQQGIFVSFKVGKIKDVAIIFKPGFGFGLMTFQIGIVQNIGVKQLVPNPLLAPIYPGNKCLDADDAAI